jgi:hypothetical protein
MLGARSARRVHPSTDQFATSAGLGSPVTCFAATELVGPPWANLRQSPSSLGHQYINKMRYYVSIADCTMQFQFGLTAIPVKFKLPL